MSLEAATYISGLIATNPLGADWWSYGDDHIRLVKGTLLNSLPNISGAMNATHTELNYMVGVTSLVQTQLDNNVSAIGALDTRVTALEGALIADPGTALSFFQAAAPTGWTQDAANDDAMLRVVGTAGGGTGGTASPTTAHTHPTAAHTLSETQMPAHNHPVTTATGTHVDDQNGGATGYHPTASNTSSTGGGGSHTHGDTGSGFAPKYVDMIICTKD